MSINITTSEFSKELIQKFTSKFQLQTENIVPRIALAYSLSKGRKLLLSEVKDGKGKPFKEETLLGKQKVFYISLICQHYLLYKSDDNIGKYVKMHIDDGLELMDAFFNSNPNHNPFDFLIDQIERGIEAIENADFSFDAVKNRNFSLKDKKHEVGLLRIEVGRDKENEPIMLDINNIKKYGNCHMSAAGGPGSGKTQFALDFLMQMCEQSHQQVKFLFLDFKGLNQDDKNKLKFFFDATQTKLIDVPKSNFPINPLSFIDNVNEKDKLMGINKFVDIIVEYSNAGSNQKQYLRDAVKEVFSRTKSGKYPTIEDVFKEVQDRMDKKPNRLLEILEGLSQYEIFEKETNKDFFNQNYYLSLPETLSRELRFTSIFLIINYVFNFFMSLDDTPVTNDIKAIRYVLLIDEAQVIFKDKKSQEVLENILRQIRSKGVSVVLLAQGIEEFNQPNFDFSSNCQISFLLDIKDKNNLKSINRFMGFTEQDQRTVKRSLEQIGQGQAITNIKDFKRGELFQIKQFKDRKA